MVRGEACLATVCAQTCSAISHVVIAAMVSTMRNPNSRFSPPEESIFNFVETTEPSELCAMLGSCLTVERLVALRPAPLSKGAIAALMPLGQVLQERRAANGAVGNDNCDTCKVRRGGNASNVADGWHTAGQHRPCPLAPPRLLTATAPLTVIVCAHLSGHQRRLSSRRCTLRWRTRTCRPRSQAMPRQCAIPWGRTRTRASERQRCKGQGASVATPAGAS